MEFDIYKKALELSKKELHDLLIKYQDIYYNNKSNQINDELFDKLKDLYESKFDKFDNVGHLPTINKIELPYYLGSLNKLKNDNELKNWVLKNKSSIYVIESKLDGVSALYYNNKLYTRGNGKIGSDITRILADVKLPNVNIPVRGELVMPKKIYNEKYKNVYNTNRNLVSSIVNSKYNDEKTKDLEFVAYQIIDSELNPLDQLIYLKKKKFNVVKYTKQNDINIDILLNEVNIFRNESLYEIDGIVVVSNQTKNNKENENPTNAFAFKEYKDNENFKITKVLDVEWQITKYNKLVPVVIIEPVYINSNIKRITGNNLDFIEKHKIGPGAIIKVMRGGDTIPKISEVIEPATFIKYPLNYVKKNKHAYDIKKNINNQELVLYHFFKTLGIVGIGNKKIKVFIDNYINFKNILDVTLNDLYKLNIGKTVSNTLFKQLQKINIDNLALLMYATPFFDEGLGFKKLNLIVKSIPDVLTLDHDEIITKISNIKGLTCNTAIQFIRGIDKFKNYIKKYKKIFIFKSNNTSTNTRINHKVNNKIFVFSGFRDKQLEDIIQEYNGIISNTITKKTNYLVVDEISNSTKVKYAKDNQIEIIKKNNINLLLNTSDNDTNASDSDTAYELTTESMTENEHENDSEKPVLISKGVSNVNYNDDLSENKYKSLRDYDNIKQFKTKYIYNTTKPRKKKNIIIKYGKIKSSNYAIFDLDYTLIKPKLLNLLPKNENDWEYLNDTVLEKLKLINKTHQIVIDTNQTFIHKIKLIYNVILDLHKNNIPTITIINLIKKYNKPDTTLIKDTINININTSFYVGDADNDYSFSKSDLEFAKKLNIKYINSLEYFKEKTNKIKFTDIIKPNIKSITILVGIPAVGKTTFTKLYEKYKNFNYKIIHSDDIKTSNKYDKMLNLTKEYIKECNVILDATFLLESQRNKFIEFAKSNNIVIICIYLFDDLNLIFNRNNKRNLTIINKKLQIKNYILHTMLAKFIEPDPKDYNYFFKFKISITEFII